MDPNGYNLSTSVMHKLYHMALNGEIKEIGEPRHPVTAERHRFIHDLLMMLNGIPVYPSDR